MTITTRQRNSVSLSAEGKTNVREMLKILGWSRDKFANKARVSKSTVGRFLHGDKIDKGYFNDLCEALSLNPDLLIAPRSNQQDTSIPVAPFLNPQSPEPSFTNYLGTLLQSLMITGTFSPDKLAEIKVALMHLEKLLQENCTITLVPDSNYFALSGTFSEKQGKQVEVTLMHLQKLLLEHSVTIDWVEQLQKDVQERSSLTISLTDTANSSTSF